jgi:LEA14-like dessication related protein
MRREPPLAMHTARRLAAILAMLLSACAVHPHLERPELSIAQVQLGTSTLWEQHLKVRVHVHNPNDRPLPVKGIEYTLEVLDEPAAAGQSDASFVVPAEGDAEFDMSFTTNLAGTLLKLLGRGPDALGQAVPYRMYGTVRLSQGWLRSIPFEQRGTFNLQP